MRNDVGVVGDVQECEHFLVDNLQEVANEWMSILRKCEISNIMAALNQFACINYEAKCISAPLTTETLSRSASETSADNVQFNDTDKPPLTK